MSEESHKKEEQTPHSGHPLPDENPGDELSSPGPSSAAPALDLRLKEEGEEEEEGEESTIVDLKRLVASDLAETISDLPPPADPLLFGKYSIIYPFAVGRKSTINVGHEGTAKDTTRLVAAKFVHPHLANDASFVAAYRQETGLRSRLRHPNVARVYDVKDKENRCLAIEELVLGQNLATVLAQARDRGIKIPNVILAEILVQVCEGLRAVYEQGTKGDPSTSVRSGALTLSNIVVSYQGAVKLVDVGVTWGKGALSENALDTIVETIGYVSPEQVLGQPRSQQGDVFTLGVFFYIMATGTDPFQGANQAERLKSLLTTDYLTPRSASSTVDSELQGIIQKAINFFPSDRFTSMREMGLALADYAERERAQNRAGNDDLSTIMQQLFSDAIDDHESKIKKYYDNLLGRNGAQTASIRTRGFLGLGGDKGAKLLAKRIAAFVALIAIVFIVTKIFIGRGGTDATLQKPETARTGSQKTASHSVSPITAGRQIPQSEPGKKTSPPKEVTPASKGNKVSEQKDNPEPVKKTQDKSPVTRENNAGQTADKKKPAPSKPEPEDQTVKIAVAGLKKGATVYLDDKKVTPPLEIESSDKTVSLRVEAPGYEPFEKKFTPDRDRTVRVRLKKIAAEQPRQQREKTKTTDPKAAPKKKKKRQKKSRTKKKSGDWEANPFG